MDTKTTGPDAQPTQRTRTNTERRENIGTAKAQAHGLLRQDFKERQRFMLRHMYDTTCMQTDLSDRSIIRLPLGSTSTQTPEQASWIYSGHSHSAKNAHKTFFQQQQQSINVD